MKLRDINVIIPHELSNEVIKLISYGINNNNFPDSVQHELKNWWLSELEYVEEQINRQER